MLASAWQKGLWMQLQLLLLSRRGLGLQLGSASVFELKLPLQLESA